MLKFSEVLSALAAPFKTLTQATAALDPAKATLDSIAALFTAAGLPLEQMLATGPDALKAHLASLDKSADVQRLTGELATATSELRKAGEERNVANMWVAAQKEIYAAVGFGMQDVVDPKNFKTAFESHVAKQTTLALAKTGHPPAHVPAADVTLTGATATDAQLAADYAKLEGSARLDFYTKHEAALWRASRSNAA